MELFIKQTLFLVCTMMSAWASAQTDELSSTSISQLESFTDEIVNYQKIWNEVSYDFQGNANSVRFRFATDSTLLDGNWYSEILRSFKPLNDDWENAGVYFRSAGSKVYLHRDFGEILFYDFDLIEEDTFKLIDIVTATEIAYVVSKVDSMTILDNTKRKRLYLRCESDPDGSLYGERTWVDGIGDLNGLASHATSGCATDQNKSLLCFYQDGNLLYTNEFTDECWVTTSVKELIELDLKIYPNPTDGLVKVSLDEISETISGITIYNLNGQIIYQQQVTNRAFQYELDLRHIKPGVLLMQLDGQKGNSWQFKLVKI